MKLFHLALIAVVLQFCLLSCASDKKEEKLFVGVMKAAEKIGLNDLDDNGVIMVINMQGCSVCYSRALYFLEKNLSHGHVTYVITGIQSKKNLAIRLGKDIVNNEKVFLDTKNYLFASDVSEPYPLIVYMNDGEFLKMDIADIQNTEAYVVLRSHLGITD